MSKTLRELLKEKNIPQSVVATALGIQQNNIKRYDDLSKRSLQEIKLISTATKIPIHELLSITDDISSSNNTEPFTTTKSGVKYFQMPNGKYRMRVPLVQVQAYAKYVDDCRDAIEWEGSEYFDFPADQVYHGNYMAFEIKGDSMDDDTKRSISHGDIVMGRELSQDKWRDKLHIQLYKNWIIVLDNTILCKQIIEHNTEYGKIICHSLNPSPEYTDFTLNLNDVRQLFNIVQKVTEVY